MKSKYYFLNDKLSIKYFTIKYCLYSIINKNKSDNIFINRFYCDYF